MTLARRLVPLQPHSLTRRTSGRRFLLQPGRRVNQILRYCLGVAQAKAPNLRLHAFLGHTNHTHGSVTDAPLESELPVFMRELNSLAARALNAHGGSGETLWSSPGSYDNVEVHDRETLEDQLLYLWTNPVKDGLVSRPEEWPGVLFLPEDFGRTFDVEKPDEAFFGGRRPADWEPTDPEARRAHRARKARAAREARERARARRKARDEQRGRGEKRRRQLERVRARRRRKRASARQQAAPRPREPRSTLPDRVTITISRPPGYDPMTLEEVRAHFRALLEAELEAIHAEREADGLTHFMGVEALLAQNPFESARDTFPTFATNPRLAGHGAEGHEALKTELREWRNRYREHLERWQRGERDVVFPCGSYELPHVHGARVEAAPRAPPF